MRAIKCPLVLVLGLSGCFGDAPGEFDVTFQVSDSETGAPIANAPIEFATVRNASFAGTQPEVDNLSELPYSYYVNTTSDSQGRFTMRIGTVVALGFPDLWGLRPIPSCLPGGGYAQQWIVRIATPQVSETVVVDADTATRDSILEGLVTRGDFAEITVEDVGCITFPFGTPGFGI